mmetsp:Transcript_10413/g.23570  ORF Transcript_10413/g.23570 Transcript_10413/m.23570 type:complete len:618 (-) Transcript_10413:135-1988(-)
MASTLQDVLLAEEGMQGGYPAKIDLRSVHYYVLDDKGKQRHILSEVTDSFPAGKLTAIMGASGSGKTSLLTLLRGLGGAGSKLSGEVLFDGKAINASIVRSTTRFVAQEDVYLPGLTPRETLSFVAQLRLSRKWTAEQRAQRINAVLSLLRLESCADTRVGDPRLNLPGCSGGERKRLSIASAIIGGLPAVLLCDEPTTGLDATSAEQVVKFLRNIADKGVTVVASIHQPAYQVFADFYHLLLLDQGRVGYNGLISDAEAVFTKAGFATPMHLNPADHYIKVIQTEDSWWKSTAASTASGSASSASKLVDASPVAEPSKTKSLNFALKAKARVNCSAFRQQVSVLTRRNLRENFKNKKRFFAGVMARLPPSVLLGVFFWQVAKESTQKYIFTTEAAFFVAVQNPIIDSFYSGLGSFQQQRPIFKREYYDGLYSVSAFFVAYYAAYFVMTVPWAMVWATPLYLLIGMPLELTRYLVFLAAVLTSILFGTALGSVIAVTSADAESARSKFTPIVIPMVMFSGFVIPYSTVAKIWHWLYLLSPMQWGLSIMSRNHLADMLFSDCPPGSRFPCYETGEAYLEVSGRTYSLLTMFGICAAYISFIVLMNVVSSTKYVVDGRP